MNPLLDVAKIVKPNYVPDWPHELMADYLVRCTMGDPEVPNLIFSTPFGLGKTELVSILFPTYLYSQNSKLHIIALANSGNLSQMASSNVLRNLQYPEFQDRWPLEFDQATTTQFTIRGGDGRPSMHAAGIGGQLTGHRADFLIFDDLLKSQSEAYSETIREKVWADFSSAAETRLLPEGKIIGIQTRWHLDDPIGRLLRRAQEDRRARQFVYVSLAAWNRGEDSFVLDTRTGEKKFLKKYKAVASIPGQPYSFSARQWKGKRADLGDTRFSALAMQQPLSLEDQLFPPECWRTVDTIPIDDLTMIATAWDCASKTGAKNDYSANVTVGRLRTGGFIVLDVWKSKVSFAELPQLVLERYRAGWQRYGQQPLLVVEDANAGTQLLQLIEFEFPQLPRIAAKPVHAKIVRAEGVTPLTRGGLVSLPRVAEWRMDFVNELANFPVGQHDDVVDAFCHAMKAFVSRDDFQKPQFFFVPRAQLSELSNEELIDIADTFDFEA